MKRYIKLLSLFTAFTLLSGCGSDEPLNETETTSEPEIAVTTTASETDATTEASLKETTEATTKEASDIPEEIKYKSISDVPAGELYKLDFDDWTINNRDITRIEGDYIYTETPSYLARTSSGILSAECNEQFTTAVENTHINMNENFYFHEKRVKVTEITEDTIYTGEENVSYSSYDNIFVKYAFVKKNNDTDYEFIIDPGCMDDIPLWSANTDFMKFEVNGTEFYGDTIKVNSYFSNTLSDIQSNDYVYAKVIFAHLSVQCDSESGYLCGADLYNIETITEDTDAVIDRSFFTEYYKDNEIYTGLTGIKGEIENLNKPRSYFSPQVMLLDLDFDGSNEVLVPYCNSDSFFIYMPVKIYSAENGKLNELADISINTLRESVYNGKRGWVVKYCTFYDAINPVTFREEGYMFISLNNGKIQQEVLGYETSDNSYFFLEEEIIPKITEFTNPYSGEEMNIYEWKDYKVQGRVYQLYEKIMEDFTNELFSFGSELIVPSSTSPYSLENLPYETVVLNLIMSDDLNKQKETDIPVAEFVYKEVADEKPVLYLYPEEEADVNVKVLFPYGGEFTCTYPEYNDGWRVTAMPDGTLYDLAGNEYYCLYWEANLGKTPETDKGFCVKGSDTADFLREKLTKIGLTAREANEFIIYWLPRMKDNEYNIISFHTDEYAEISPLLITPTPDSVIRIFMTYYSADEAIEIEPQVLPEYERTGFTAVEWGGGEIK